MDAKQKRRITQTVQFILIMVAILVIILATQFVPAVVISLQMENDQ